MINWRKLSLIIAICLSMVAAFAAGAMAADKAKVKAAFVYVGPIGDHGWTYAHNQGRLDLEKHFGIETTYIENVMDADAERVINQLARQGYNPIFTTSFGYMDPTLAVAKRFPDTVFMHCSGFKRAKNVGTYFGKMYQARYLTGMIAGAMTKTNVIGYVNAFPIPECIRLANAFMVGVRETNPKAKVHVVWTNSWIDSAKGKEAAKALLSVNADVITQGIDPPGPQEAAVEADKLFIGWDSDMGPLAPEHTLTSTVWQWKSIYRDVVQKVIDGTWKSEDYYWGMDKDIVSLAPYGPRMPEDLRKVVNARMAELKAGKFTIFKGPLTWQDGTVFLKEGETADVKTLLSMTKFLDGIVGTPK